MSVDQKYSASKLDCQDHKTWFFGCTNGAATAITRAGIHASQQAKAWSLIHNHAREDPLCYRDGHKSRLLCLCPFDVCESTKWFSLLDTAETDEVAAKFKETPKRSANAILMQVVASIVPRACKVNMDSGISRYACASDMAVVVHSHQIIS